MTITLGLSAVVQALHCGTRASHCHVQASVVVVFGL